MTQYTNTYGTVYSVRDYKGEPRIMCRAKASCDWLISGALAVEAAAANTIESLQQVLDNHARTHGWQPLEGPASAEPPEIVDECSDLDLPYPGDVYRSAKGGQLYKIGELTNGKKTCYLTMRCNVQGGTWVPANSSVYPNLSDAQGEFEAWIRREQLEPVAQTMDAAAITDELAAKEPSKVAETSTVSPENSLDVSSCPSAEPARQAPAALPLSAPDTAPMSLPAFDYTGLDADTAEKLRGITDRVMELSQTYAWGMAYQVGRAHDLLCGDGACETVSQAHKRNNQHSENTFTAWCAYIGVERRSAYNLLNAYRLICKATPEQQKNLQLAPAKLLYVAGKKDTPDQLANAVLDGDITSHKQYQELLARLKAAQSDKAAAERKATQCEEMKDSALETARQAQEDAASAESRARAAERERDEARKERDGAREALQASKMRGDRLKAENDDLKARPIEVPAVDEDEIDRRVEARLQQERDDSLAEQREIAARNAQDAILLLGRQINTSWQMVRPFLAEMEESRRVEAIDRINNEWAQTQKEILQCL